MNRYMLMKATESLHTDEKLSEYYVP